MRCKHHLLVYYRFRNAFRARPINDGVKPQKPVVIEKKPPTIPEPFKLTETKCHSYKYFLS